MTGTPYNPPYNLEAEQDLLGDALFCPAVSRRLDELAEIVRPEHFYDPVHRVLWDAAVRFVERGQPITAEALRRILEHSGAMVGDPAREYIAGLKASGSGMDPRYLARAVQDYAVRRFLMEVAQDILADAATDDPERSAVERLETAEQRLYDLAEIGTERSGGSTMDQVMDATLALIERSQQAADGMTGVPTGITDLDRRLGGLQGGELYIVAGRPAMGKTALGLTVAHNAARAGFRVRFQSLEMPKQQLGQRLVAQRTGISVQAQRLKPSPEEGRRIAEAEGKIRALPLVVDDDDYQTVASIRSAARRHKRRGGLDLLVVDYLGLIQPVDPRAVQNRAYQIEDITKNLKRLAKSLDIPVLLLCQINRGVEQRDDKRPTLSDLRDSGAIEQDADVVMLLYREEYYLGKEVKTDEQLDRLEQVRGKAECLVAKFRQGETGTDVLQFDGVRQRFSSLDKWGR